MKNGQILFSRIYFRTLYVLLVTCWLGAIFATSAHAKSAAEFIQEAWAERSAGNLVGALASIDRALETLHKTGKALPQDLAFVLNEKSVILRASDAAQNALEAAERAVQILEAESIDNEVLIAAFINQGLAAQDLGHLDTAYLLQDRATGLADALNADVLFATASTHKASIAMQRGQFLVAERDVNSALARAVDSAPMLASLHHLRAKSLLARRIPELASNALNSARDIPELGFRLLLENDLLQGRVLIQQSRPKLARELLSSVAMSVTPGIEDLKASALYNLAELDFISGRYPEAEEANQKAEAAFRRLHPSGHPVIGQIRHRQALILQQVGDLDRALDQFAFAQSMLSETVGNEHPLWLATEAERSRTLSKMGRYEEALTTARSVLLNPAFQSDELGASRILALAAVGLTQKDAGDNGGAIETLEAVRSLRGGGQYSRVDEPPGLLALAELYMDRGDTALARDMSIQALELLNQLQSNTVDELGEARRIRAAIALQENDDETALRLVRQNVAAAEEQLVELARSSSYAADFAPVALRGQLAQALDLMYLYEGVTSEELFRVAQLSHLNEVTRATNGLLKGVIAQDPSIAALFRSRGELGEELRLLSAQMLEAETEGDVFDRMADLQSQKASLDAQIMELSPELETTLSPSSVALSDIQRLLDIGEALWLHAAPGESSFVFLVTLDDIFASQTNLGSSQLDTLVRKVRRTLDQSSGDGLIPFDFVSAAELYEGLFQPFETQLEKIDRLVVVPDGAAQQVSLGVLVRTVEPIGKTNEGADRRFLGLTKALAVVPSVSSFRALRLAGRLPKDRQGFVGFGDPRLEGPITGYRGSPIDRLTGVARAGAVASLFDSLPETVEELEKMALTVPEGHRRLYFSQMATETTVKNEVIQNVSTLAFATHAIMSGDFGHLSEPALILTPPDEPTKFDDGLLTVSEISQLDLDVDLVILSACNTGSPIGRPGAPGLTGLASGFFKAGARSLVVSHWTIFSISSVLLMPPFLEGTSGEENLPPSEAMRRAMVQVATRPDNSGFAHPAVWGPFVVVSHR